MIDLLRRAAVDQPTRAAVVSPRGTTSYGELAAHAQVVADNLSERRIARFAVLDDRPERVLAVLAGAAAAGVQACVYPLNANATLVQEHRSRFDHGVLVSNRLGMPGTIATEEMMTATARQPSHRLSAEQPTVLVMTTGTTGHPKGVVHAWSRLLAPTCKIRPRPEDRWLLAFGLNQFGGLQILLQVVAAHSTLVVTDGFVPRLGLEAVRAHQVTHISATPTYWRFLLAELAAEGGPAPELQQVTLSGEAVPADLLAQIRATFPSARVSQIYAASEFGQGLSVRDGSAGLPASLLEADGHLSLRIDEGELFVRSGSAMLGYYGVPTPTDPADEEWRPTGDLVEVVGDRIEFRGRRSDVINVGGVKVHPLPVEQRIAQLPEVSMARVFGRPSS